MAEDKEPPARRGAAFMAFVAQWQVLLTLAVGAFGLLYNFNEQRRVELSLNREAVTAARADAERFRADPQNTLAEYQATYPEHAYCASLGFFVAEGGRLSREAMGAEPGRPGPAFVDVSDALLGKVEAQAAAIGLEPEDFRASIEAALERAAPRDGATPCAGVEAIGQSEIGPLVRLECRLVVGTYLLNRCNLEREARERAGAVISANAFEMGAPPAEPPPPPASGEPPAPGDVGVGGIVVGGVAGPGEPCGGASPIVFPQFADPADRDRIGRLRERLVAAGWQLAASELVANSRTLGDVRIYNEAQRPCGARLAEVVAALPEVERPIRVISLADRYRGLPGNQMELWLPALN